MNEYRIIGAENFDLKALLGCRAVFCTYWHQWVLYEECEEDAYNTLNENGIYCKIEKLNTTPVFGYLV